MIGTRTAALPVLALLTLAACQARDPVTLCAASGDPAVGITAFAHDASGLQLHVTSGADGSETRIEMRRLAAPIVEDFWSDADHTFQATRRGELSPCDGAALSFIRVTFSNGDVEERQTRCEGNALARLTQRVLDASAEDRPGAERTEEFALGTPEDAIMACEWAHERF